MAVRTDILLDANFDLPIETNNFTLGQSDEQHMYDCMISYQGWWKQFPKNGVGINRYLKSRISPLVLQNNVKLEFARDGYIVDNPTVKAILDTMNVNVKATA